jgi:beta-exotoxin I transport system permease protein
MAWAIFKDTLRESMRITFIWGFGLAAMMVLMVLMVPTMAGINFVSLLEGVPPVMLASLGMGDDISVLATPEGLIAFGFFGKMALIFAAFPVVMGLRATSQEEAEGTLDMVLSLPIARWRVVLEKFLAYSIDIMILAAMMIIGLYIGIPLIDIELDTRKLTLLILNIVPVLIFVLAMTIFVAALISRRQQVVSIMTVFVIASFIIQTVGAMVTAAWMDVVEAFSFFTYYNIQRLLSEGIVALHIVILLVFAAALIGASLYAFERRDIASAH